MTEAWFTRPCPAPSQAHRQHAIARQRQLTKPEGALGRLETLAIELAALQGREQPQAARVPVLVFAGDHGVAVQGVSAYPAEVTVQMLRNFAAGGAAIAVLSRELGLPLHVWDVGSLADAPLAGVTCDKPRRGTDDFSAGPAMAPADLEAVFDAGRRAVEATCGDGADLLLLGEMGIGNTTSASALAAVLGPLPLADLVGAGTGLDAARIAHKQAVTARALALHGEAIAAAADPGREALRRVGGLEIAALAAAMIAAAQRGVPVLVDGFIVSAAALAAVRINPSLQPWLLFSHRSAERGHARVLATLQADPLLQLDLRLGEGSGAALALPLLRLACALHNGMATFAEAAIAGRSAAP
ncbi:MULTISPECIES: nicotinate-nucleotide--dimethylbenzimidazole phosphoribosyltransferase [Stenotrophomonas]|uniref:Nicotinate-nucleotide--dimethylbenzimidazole phosphoribosyltransferase n=1 Tax=Stenotrophomonas nitritireducens TaxID=83617 RepID=A0ABR5NGT4_9GAMM|nr:MULTISPECIES: nicotinate-nucleotide--dimethylbenzimidazole phosphoribosyltransferase [Stenotrophomonas]KQN95907.1 nicotinate-nucleotide--dimethylbenzimidazole phosphoribosyltransferase [Stenotrophomonas sp. Leaf70]KRG55030.1 nicotinate-nucleotide--dimethylbenzimidazole phosphoribosyltransferase [Stenotrophomonas nitritireducens]